MRKKYYLADQRGASLFEVLVVLVIMGIIATFAFLGMSSKQLFAADKQAAVILDMLQEARQRALTQGETLRVEINDTKKLVRLIDENGTTTPTDDVVLSSSKFDTTVTVGVKPANVNAVGGIVPTSTSPVPEISFTQTTYPMSANDKVETLRFIKTGEVVDGGTDNLGTGAISSGTTIYVYNGASGSKSSVVRAITVSGITAVSQVYKCQPSSQGTCVAWVK